VEIKLFQLQNEERVIACAGIDRLRHILDNNEINYIVYSESPDTFLKETLTRNNFYYILWHFIFKHTRGYVIMLC